MDAYFKYFGSGNTHTNFLVNNKELLKNIIRYRIELKIYLAKNSIVKLFIKINILKLK